MDLNQLFGLAAMEAINKTKKTNLWKGENISHDVTKRLISKNIQTAHTAHFNKKPNNPIRQWARRPK